MIFALILLLASDVDFEAGARSARERWQNDNCRPRAEMSRPVAIDSVTDFEDGLRAAERDLTIRQREMGTRPLCRELVQTANG